MHTVIRTIHLYCALILATFVSMYFATGYVLTRPGWFGDRDPITTTRTEPLGEEARRFQPDDPAFLGWLKNRFEIGGRAGAVRKQQDGGWKVDFHRPGYTTSLTIPSDFANVNITESQLGWRKTWIGFHRLHGYHGGWLYVVWAFIYDLASLSMIVFAITGVVLWYQLSKNKIPGLIVLGIGFVYTLSTVLYLMYLP